MGPSRGIGIALLALVALAAVSRWVGLDRLQPHSQEADGYVVLQMQRHRDGSVHDGDPPIAYFAYPTLAARALAWIPEARLGADAGGAGEVGADEILERSLAVASADFVRVRTFVALVSILLVPLTWLLAKRFLGGALALVAAACVAFSALHLLFSQQARPHGLQATCALASVLCALRMRARPSFGTYLCGALAAGAAFAFLHNGVAALLPLVAAHLLRDRRAAFPPGFTWWGAALLCVPSACAYWAFYPSQPKVVGSGGETHVLDIGGHTLPLTELDGSGFPLVADYLWDYEPALLVASLLRRRQPADPDTRARNADALIAGAYALPYLAALGLMGLTQDRFLIPLLPFLACLAAWPVALARGKPALAGALAALVLAFPMLVAIQFTRLAAAPDTIELAAQWVGEHVDPAEERVVTSARLDLPLFLAPEALRVAAEDYATRQSVWIGWQLTHLPLEDEAPFAGGTRWKLFSTPGKLLHMKQTHDRGELEGWLARADADYAILERSRRMEFLPQAAVLRELVAERGELVAAVRGEDERWCTERPQDYQEIPDFVPRILAATAFGPCIEIYRLAR
jgi:hypothetical protein